MYKCYNLLTYLVCLNNRKELSVVSGVNQIERGVNEFKEKLVNNNTV
jgi:hypothetical protein